jgi:hypothetical protein
MSETPQQRQRAKELDRISRLGPASLVSPGTHRVVGVTFAPTYPENLHRLEALLASVERHPASEEGEGAPAIIVRSPDNPADTNACEVHVPSLGELAMIGWLTAPVAARLAPELDAGVVWQGQVVDVLVHPDHSDHPGITIKLERITDD